MRLLILLAVLSFAYQARGQSIDTPDRTPEEISVSYPFERDATGFDRLQHEFYLANQQVSVHMDSLYALITSDENPPVSRMDSAAFLLNIANYHERKQDLELSRQAVESAGVILNDVGHEKGRQFAESINGSLDYHVKDLQSAFDRYNAVLNSDSIEAYLEWKMSHNCAAILMELRPPEIVGHVGRYHADALAEIEAFLDRAMQTARDSEMWVCLSRTLAISYNVKIAQDDFIAAKAVIDEGEEIALASHNINQLSFLKIKRANLLGIQGRTEEAIALADEAVEYYDALGHDSQAIHALSMKFIALDFVDRHEEAKEVSREMYYRQKAKFQSELAESDRKYREAYEAEKREYTIKEQKATIVEDQLRLDRRNRTILIIILASIALIGLVLAKMQRNKRTAQMERDALIIKNREEGIKAIISTQEEERKRIAKDLHDGIVQQLGALKLGLNRRFQDQQDDEAERLMAILDESTQELREVSHRMMPRSLSELGLVAALKDMLEKSLGVTEIRYTFESFGIEGRFNESIEIGLYRICQEIVNNVIKHSDASEVSIQLMKNRERLILIAEDNGVGMDGAVKSSGIGLKNITSRAGSVNGRVDFSPSPDSGTLVTVSIPLTEHE